MDLSGLPETAVDSEEDDDEEDIERASDPLMSRDIVRDCLEKDPMDRTDDDIGERFPYNIGKGPLLEHVANTTSGDSWKQWNNLPGKEGNKRLERLQKESMKGRRVFFVGHPLSRVSEHIKIWLAELHLQLRFSGAVPSTGHRVPRQTMSTEQNLLSSLFLFSIESLKGLGTPCHTS